MFVHLSVTAHAAMAYGKVMYFQPLALLEVPPPCAFTHSIPLKATWWNFAHWHSLGTTGGCSLSAAAAKQTA